MVSAATAAVGLSVLRHAVTIAGAAALFTGKIDPTDINTIGEGLQMAGGVTAMLFGMGAGAAQAQVTTGTKAADPQRLADQLQSIVDAAAAASRDEAARRTADAAAAAPAPAAVPTKPKARKSAKAKPKK